MQRNTNWKSWLVKLGRLTGFGFLLAALFLATGAGAGSASAANYQLFGTVRDSLGNPVPNINISAVSSTGARYNFSSSASGFYAGTLPEGTYTLGFRATVSQHRSATATPGEFISTAGPAITLDAPTLKDFTMDLAAVAVTVTDTAGMPVANAVVTAKGSGETSLGAAGTFSATMSPLSGGVTSYMVRTDNLGNATVYLPKGLAYEGAIAYPPAGNPFYSTALGTLTGNMSVPIQQPTADRTFSGTMRDSLGSPIFSTSLGFARLFLTDTVTGVQYAGDPSSAAGSRGVFNLAVPSAKYRLNYHIIQPATTASPSGNTGVRWSNNNPVIDLTANSVTQNIEYNDSAIVTVRVIDADGNPLPNRPVVATGEGPINIGGGQYAGYLFGQGGGALPTTDASGNARLYLPKGMSYSSVGMLSNEQFRTAPLGVVNSNMTVTLQLPRFYTYSGTFRDKLGNPIPGQLVTLQRSASGGDPTGFCSADVRYSAFTNPDGTFAVSAPANTYCLAGVLSTTTGAFPPGSTQFFNYDETGYFNFTGDTQQNLVPDTATYTVTVVDTAGNPIPNVSISFFNPSPPGYFSLAPGMKHRSVSTYGATTSARTNSDGVISFNAFKGMAYQLVANTGSSPQPTLQDTQFVGDKSIVLRQQAGGGVFAVTGTVTDQSLQTMSGVLVEVINPATGLTAGTATTNTSGSYSTSVSSGVYSVRFTPPSGSGLLAKTLTGVNITANTALDVTLTPPASTLSGSVANTAGTGISGVSVQVVEPSDHNVVRGGTATGSGGTYSVTVTPGTYDVIFTPASSYHPATRASVDLNVNARLDISLERINRVLTGRVVNGSNEPIEFVAVKIVQPADHSAVVATAITNGTGSYSAEVAPGTYDVIFTPIGNVYQATTQASIGLANDATLDVALVLAPRTFSGTFTDGSDMPIAGATISLSNQGGQTFSTTTDDGGSFSVQVNPTYYSLRVTGTQATAPLATVPKQFTLSGGTFDLTADINQGLTLPTVTQTFTTKNVEFSSVVGNVALAISTTTYTALYSNSGTYSGDAAFTVTTDASTGVATVVMLTGSTYRVQATPPAGANVLATNFPVAGPVTADDSHDLPLEAIIRTFSGTLKHTSGSAIGNASIRLNRSGVTFSATTSPAGEFSISAPAASFTASVSGSGGTNLPSSFNLSTTGVDLSTSDLTQDMVLNTDTNLVSVTSPSGALLTGMVVQLLCSGSIDLYPGGTYTGSASSSGTTNTSGQVDVPTIAGFACTYTVVPPAGSGYVCGSSTSADIVCQRRFWTVSGTLKDRTGSEVAGATVRLDGDHSDLHYSAITDTAGAFHIDVAQYSGYNLTFAGTQLASPGAILPDNFQLTRGIAITADTAVDVIVDTVNLTIVSRDNRLNTVPHVAIDFSSSGSQSGYSASSSHIFRDTGVNGQTHLVMLKNTGYTISATPPAGIGYINITFQGTNPITTDAETIIEFQNRIPLTPTGLGVAETPTRNPPVLSWNAVEGATRYKIYRDDSVVNTAAATSYTDYSLTTDNIYQYRISAVSEYGYESPRSSSVTVLYDTTAPVLGNPELSANPKSVRQTSELRTTVSDAGTGTASGEYFIGADPGIGNATAMTVLSSTLTTTIGTNLTAGEYVISIRAQDSLGTWSSAKTITLTVVPPAPPTGITGPTYTNSAPALTWTASQYADKYYVYRDGTKTGETTTTNFTDGDVVTLDAQGAHTYTVSAATALGDESIRSETVTVFYDSVAPDITAQTTPGPNTDGWHNHDVTIRFTCADTHSGIKSCPAPITVTAEAAAQAVTGTTEDNAGNTAATTLTVSLDKTTPTITPTHTPANPGGWNNTDVTTTFTCADALSGIAACPTPVTLTSEGMDQSTSGTTTDRAGHAASAGVTGVNIDKTAPLLATPTWTVNPKPVGSPDQPVTTTLSIPAADALSGVQHGEYFIGTDPGIGQATPLPYLNGALIATLGASLPVGVYDIGVRAKDAADNWSTTTNTMLVVFDPTGAGITGRSNKDLIPSLANGDALPGLTQDGQTDSADYGFTVDYRNGSMDHHNDFHFTYTTGTRCNTPTPINCHQLTLDATTFDWLIVDQTNNSHGRFQGTATVTIDGTTTNNPFTVEGIDGDRLTPTTDDRLTIRIYPPNTNPLTTNWIYQASGSIPKGNAIRIR